MRYLPVLLLLASCQTWGWSDTADALMPDEFTMGQGQGTHLGNLATHSPEWPYEGESESTFVALTWDLPGVNDSDGMSRETQRNFSLLVDHMVAEEGLIDEPIIEGEAIEAGPLTLNLRPGVTLPPKEVLFGILGAAVLLFMLVRMKARSSRRQW